MTHRILILGGTTEARQLAAKLALRNDLAITISLAGRTIHPVAHSVPVRVGGFGGVDGLARYLRENAVELLIDATHPFAARISANAVAAAPMAGVGHITLRRAEWKAVDGDLWIEVDNVEDAAFALGDKPLNVFLALGRQELAPFEACPQHSYLIRSVDPVEPPLNVPNASYILGRGPFSADADEAMLDSANINVIVAKNSGGDATYGKLVAARALGIPVILVQRSVQQETQIASTVDEAVTMVDHWLKAAEKRGV